MAQALRSPPRFSYLTNQFGTWTILMLKLIRSFTISHLGGFMSNLRDKPYVTYLLLGVMVIVFALMSVMGGTENPMTLVQFGAKYNPLIRAGQYWRLITPMFIHIGFTHILMNGITLYFIGQYVEELFGHWRFAIIFFVSGILGNLGSFAFTAGLSAGASTAIFGLFGAFMMLGESFSKTRSSSRWQNFHVIYCLKYRDRYFCFGC